MILIVCVVMSFATALSFGWDGDEIIYLCAAVLDYLCAAILMGVAYRIAKFIKKFTGKK